MSSRASQSAGLVAYGLDVPGVRVSQVYALMAYAPTQARSTRAEQSAALVPYGLDETARPRVSQSYALVVWTTGIGQEARTRAWAFTLDGHPFYVLDLGVEGTFLYDSDTQQWCQWRTAGWDGWNLRNGTRWGEPERVVGGDAVNGIVWELDPDLTEDEGFKEITHISTGGLMTRERVYRAVEAVRIAGSIGALSTTTGATITLEFSDDGGETFGAAYVVDMTSGNFTEAIEWRSLGSFRSPGRVFRVTDVGGMLRIDGADVYVDGWDDEGSSGDQVQG